MNKAAPAVPSDKWKKYDDKARATISLTVEDNQLIYISLRLEEYGNM